MKIKYTGPFPVNESYSKFTGSLPIYAVIFSHVSEDQSPNIL